MGKLKLNSKQAILAAIGLIGIVSVSIGIAYYNREKEYKIEKLNEYVMAYKDEAKNYILDDFEEEYNELTDDFDTRLKEKDLSKAEEGKRKLESLKDQIVNKNEDTYNEKYQEVNNLAIDELDENKKQEIENKKDEVNDLSSAGKFKNAIEDIDKLKEYISVNIEEVKKQKEEEKRKQEEEEQKKKDEEDKKKKEQDSSNQESKESSTSNLKSNPKPNYNSGSYVSKLKASQETNQLIIVKGEGGSNAVVEFHVKDESGTWNQVFSTSAFVGQDGISYNKSESDNKTPAGVFSIGKGFGVAGNPGANIAYSTLTNNDYWVDDPNSKYYNKWVDGNTPNRDWNSAEHMIQYAAAYKYGIVINYNTYNTIPGKGSAIFLHCKTYPTAGCVGIPENYMIGLLKQINSSARIIISPSEEGIYNF